LGLKAGSEIVLVGASATWSLPDCPDDITVRRVDFTSDIDASDPSTVVVAFFADAVKYQRRIAHLASSIFPAGSIWIAWPRRAGGHLSDMSDTLIRDHALPLGIVDNKVAAIDADWSGLRFVWRKERRDILPID
jgi:hypothetical protein